MRQARITCSRCRLATYDVKAELSGFRTAIREKLALPVDVTTRFDVQMAIGALTETDQRPRRGQSHQRHRRQPRQRHLGPAGSRAAARGQQRQRPAQPAARRGLRAQRAGQRQPDRRGPQHRPAQRRRQRRARRSVQHHARRHRRQRPAVRHGLRQRPAHDARLAAGVPRQHQQLRRRSRPVARARRSRWSHAAAPTTSTARPTGCSATRAFRATPTF